jgi:hypothetical protein
MLPGLPARTSRPPGAAQNPASALFCSPFPEGLMLDYALANKMQKAKRYAEEPERIHFRSMEVDFDGVNGHHTVGFDDGHWTCDCPFFTHHDRCSHTMAMERVLGVMRPATNGTS